MRRPSLLVNAGLGVVALAGALWAYQTVAVSNTTSSSTAGNQRYATVQAGTVVSTASATGTVQSANTANADFGTSGTVTEIDVKVGDAVTKGQVLARLDPTAAQDQLNTANANLASAQQSLARANAAAPVDASAVASAQAQVAQAQVAVDADQRALDGTVLKAPMAGTVTAVNGSAGGRFTVQLVTGTGKTQTTVVQVGVQGDTFDEITGGLTEGQQVAIQRQATTGASTGPGGGIFGPGSVGGAGGNRRGAGG